MKSIDALLSEVAKNLNATPQPNRITALTLNVAKEIAYAIECAAEKMGISVVISVYDKGANPVLLNAMDNSYIASVRIAQDKAYTAAALKMPTHIALKESRGGSLDGLTNGNGIMLLGGGYPLKSGDEVFGAVGVSGGTKEEDIALSKLGADYFLKRLG